MHIGGDTGYGVAFLPAVVEGERQDEDFVVAVAAQVVDCPDAHIGHEITGKEASEVAEEKGNQEQQAHEDQRMVFPSIGNEAAHEPVEIAH